MDPTEITIRRLEGEADAALYRDIRLESLKRHPEAFLAEHATEAAQPFAHFVQRLTDSAVFGALDGDTIVGLAGYHVERAPRRAHKGMLWGVYVRREARGSGLARQLVEAVLEHAAGHVEALNLVAERGNMPARRLYTALGFVEYGLEKDAVRIGDRYFDDVLMTKALR
jgi:GNAT superfamily N-acetyltransferase